MSNRKEPQVNPNPEPRPIEDPPECDSCFDTGVRLTECTVCSDLFCMHCGNPSTKTCTDCEVRR